MIDKRHENLIPNTQRSANEVRKNQQRGGINSGKTRKAKKAIKNMIELMLTSKLDSKNAEKIAEAYNIDVATVTKEAAIIHSVMTKCLKSGDVQAFNALMDRVYGKPVQEIQQHNTHEQGSVLTLNMVKAKDVTKTEDKES